MWKLSVFLIPCKDFGSLTYEELLEFDRRITKIEEQESFQIPEVFYNTKDTNQQTIFEMILESKQSDVTDYLFEISTKRPKSNKNYEEIKSLDNYAYTAFVERDVDEDKKELSIINVDDRIDNDKPYEGIIPGDIIKVKRNYLINCRTYDEFKEKVVFCFHRLVFHPDAFLHMAKLGKCEDVIQELMRHLCALNDYGDKIYQYTGKNEKNALSELQSAFQIICSGKGSNEKMTYNKELIFKGNKYILTCNPHTKLFKKHSNQRIYFCWGRDEIEDHKIIVVKIGDHWEE